MSVRRALPLLPALLVVTLGAYLLTAEVRHARAFAHELRTAASQGPLVGLSPGVTSEDVAAVLALYRGTLNSWCLGSGASYGAAFTDDAVYVGFDGSVARGRARIVSWHQALFDGWLKGSCLKGAADDLQFTGRDSAVLLARGGTSFNGGPVRRPSVQTYVARRTADGWRFQSFQNGRIISRTPVHYGWLAIKSALLGM